MNAQPIVTGTPLPLPPDFPVIWPDPADAQYHWTRDREHMPEPITPMFASAAAIMARPSHARAAAAYNEAVVGRRDLAINTYNYTRLVPFTGTPEELAARVRSFREKVSAAAFRLAELWEEEWRPELERHWAFWAAFDLAGADLPALLAHLEETLVRGARLYEIHYLLGSPMWFAIDEFETCYCDLFPGTTPLDAHRLLQGFDNKTLEIGRALWRLSRLARALPAVRQVLATRPAADVERALAQSAEGRLFLAEFRAFLSGYGRRSNLWDWGYPSWEEDPTPVIHNLKNYLQQPDRDLEAELAQAAAEREVAVAQARQALAGYPAPVVERFEQLLQAAQVALVLTENHTYYMDFNGFGWIRRVIREFGKRFTATGQLAEPNEIFYLTVEELRALAADPALNGHALAHTRQAEALRWAAYPEPAEIGVRPAEPLYFYSPDARRMLRYVGGWSAETPRPEPEPGVLSGQAGSPGRVRGTARVILSLADAHRLRPGDILVTTTTAPPWTPLFLTVAAVVTDAGGLLSHGAVVSREYRIPAVVGTGDATTRIQDGQEIEVDGTHGVVYLKAEGAGRKDEAGEQ